MDLKRLRRMSYALILLALFLTTSFGARVFAQDESYPLGIKVEVVVPDEGYSQNEDLHFTVKLSGAVTCEANFTWSPKSYSSHFGKDLSSVSNAEAKGIIEKEFWPYRNRRDFQVYSSLIPERLKRLVESLNPDSATLFVEGEFTDEEFKILSNEEFENRARQLKVIATLLEIAVSETKGSPMPNGSSMTFTEIIGDDKTLKDDYVAVWRGAWNLMDAYEFKASQLALGDTESTRTRVQALLFNPEGLDEGVFQRLMRSHAALFDERLIRTVGGQISREEAFATLLERVYKDYRLPIPAKGDQRSNGITILKPTWYDDSGYSKYAMANLTALMKYVATSPHVTEFLANVKEPNQIAPDSTNQVAASVIQTKAALLFKYLDARKTLADEDKMLEIVRYINGVRLDPDKNLRTKERLCRNETIRNLYEAATGDPKLADAWNPNIYTKLNGIWDAEIYLRYVFLLSIYEKGGVGVVGTEDAFEPENYGENVSIKNDVQKVADVFIEKLVDQNDETKKDSSVQQFQRENWRNTLEDDWTTFFGDDFGSFGQKKGLGIVLHKREGKADSSSLGLEPTADSSDAPPTHDAGIVRQESPKTSEVSLASFRSNVPKSFLELANDVPNGSSVEAVSRLIEGSVNILYFKSRCRMLERYYRPKSAEASSGFDVGVYLGLVNAATSELEKQFNRIFPEHAPFATPTPEFNKMAQKIREAMDIPDVASACERALLTEDLDKLAIRMRNLWTTQAMVFSARKSVYSSDVELNDFEEKREVYGSLKESSRGKLTYVSIAGTLIGDYPIIDLDAMPNYTLNDYVEFVVWCVQPYLDALDEAEKDALAYVNAEFDMEIAQLEIQAQEMAREIAELGVKIAKKWVQVSAVEIKISALNEKMTALVEKDANLNIERSVQALEIANRANELLEHEIEELSKFVDDALPQLKDIKLQMDDMCQKVVRQAEKIEEERRKAAKKSGLFKAIRGVVSVVGIAASIFTGGSSLAATTMINSALDVVEHADQLKFDSFEGAVSSLSYIGGKVEGIMTEFDVPMPEIVNDAQKWFNEEKEMFNGLKKGVEDTFVSVKEQWNSVEKGTRGVLDDLKKSGLEVLDGLKDSGHEALDKLKTVGLDYQNKALESLSSRSNAEAFNSLNAIRNGDFMEVLSGKGLEEWWEKRGKDFNQFNLNQLKGLDSGGLQNAMNELAGKGLALKSKVSDLKDEKIRKAIEEIGEMIGTDAYEATLQKARDAVKKNASELFDDLGAECDQLHRNAENELNEIHERAVKRAEKKLNQIQEAGVEALDWAKSRVSEEFEQIKQSIEEAEKNLTDARNDAKIDNLLEELDLVEEFNKFLLDLEKAYEDVASIDLVGEVEELFNVLSSKYQETANKSLDKARKAIDDICNELNGAIADGEQFVQKLHDDLTQTFENALALTNLKDQFVAELTGDLDELQHLLNERVLQRTREEMDEYVKSRTNELKSSVESVTRAADRLKNDVQSFANHGGSLSALQRTLKGDFRELSPKKLRAQGERFLNECQSEFKQRAEKVREEIELEVVAEIVKKRNERVDSVYRQVLSRLDNLEKSVNQTIGDVVEMKKLPKELFDSCKGSLVKLSDNLRAIANDTSQELVATTEESFNRVDAYVEEVGARICSDVEELRLDVENMKDGFMNRLDEADHTVDQFSKKVEAIVNDINIPQGAEEETQSDNFLHNEPIDMQSVVNERFRDLLQGEGGDTLADFLIDSIRSGGQMVFNKDENVVVVVPTVESQLKKQKENEQLAQEAKREIYEITSEYTENITRIQKELSDAVEKAGGEPDALRKLAAKDGPILKAKEEFQKNYDKIVNKLEIMRFNQQKEKAKVKLAETDVEIAKVKREIALVEQEIAALKSEKANLEYEAREKELEKSEETLVREELKLNAAYVRNDQAEFNNAVYQKRLQALESLPAFKDKIQAGVLKTPSGELDVDALQDMLVNDKIDLQATGSTSVLNIIDPTQPSEVVFNDAIVYFSGILQWMKCLDVTQRDVAFEEASSDNSSKPKSMKFSVNERDYMWYARELSKMTQEFPKNEAEAKAQRKTKVKTRRETVVDANQTGETVANANQDANGGTDSGDNQTDGADVNADGQNPQTSNNESAFQTTARERLQTLLSWCEEIKQTYINSGKNPANTIFAADQVSPVARSKDFCEIRYFVKPKSKDDDSWRALNSPNAKYRVENIDSDQFLNRRIEQGIGAPLAKILVWYRPPKSEGNFGRIRPFRANSREFTPYVLADWVQVLSKLKTDDKNLIDNLHFDVVDPDGVLVVNDLEVVIEDRFDEKTSRMQEFDQRALKFHLREMEGLWTIYIYDVNESNPYRYCNTPDVDKSKSWYMFLFPELYDCGTYDEDKSKRQNLEVIFRYVKVRKD